MSSSSIITAALTALTLAAGVAAVTPSEASAAPVANLAGWGVRDYGSFYGNVDLNPDFSITGTFSIVIEKPGQAPIYCHYTSFRPNQISGNSWNFDAYGTCYDGCDTFRARNRIATTDYGTPGVGVDYIDVNYYGAVGVSIPGGFFDDGDLIWTN